MERYKKPNDELNSPKYYSGKECIERGCSNPAGTSWSPLWCQFHNAERLDRITKNLENIIENLENKDRKWYNKFLK